MTTLTERLRELAALQYPYSGLTRGELADEAKDSIALAQELHALLVECGEASAKFYDGVARDAYDIDGHKGAPEIKSVLEKLRAEKVL